MQIYVGMCGAAGMYLKGEGTAQNITRAISLYENASSLGSIRALNGLGKSESIVLQLYIYYLFVKAI